MTIKLLALGAMVSLSGCGPVARDFSEARATRAAPAMDELFALNGHAAAVADVAYTPDAQQIISCDTGGHVMFWSAVDGRSIWQSAVSGVTFSHVAMAKNGQFAAVVGANFVGLIALKDGTWIKRFPLVNQVAHNAVAISDDMTTLVLGSSDTAIRLIDFATGAVTELGRHDLPIQDVQFMNDDRVILAADPYTIRTWDIDSRTDTRIVDTTLGDLPSIYWMSRIAFSSDGNNVMVAAGNDALVYDLSTHEVTQTLRGHADEIITVLITYSLSEAFTSSRDHSTRLWDLDSGTIEATATLPTSTLVTTIKVSPVEDRLVLGSIAFESSGSMRTSLSIWGIDRH